MSEIAAVILAAGKSSRYLAAGGAEPSKLVAEWRGRPVVRWVAESALASRARPVIVVTGHARGEVEAALAGLPVAFAHNPDFASGLATSLRTGVAALGEGAAGAIVLLGDMPDIAADTIDRVLEGFLARSGAAASVPVLAGRRGNPVLLGRRLFGAVSRLRGDEGARGMLREAGAGAVVEVVVAAAGVVFDVDTPRDLAAGVEPSRPSMDPETIIRTIVDWAKAQPTIEAVALVGSHARGTAHAGSDIDLVLLASVPNAFRADTAWVDAIEWNALGVRPMKWEDEDHGELWSRRLWLEHNGGEVEFGFVSPSWAALRPVDPGTRRVIGDGCRILHDPKEILSRLRAAVRGLAQ